jgi:hypothetical protein
MEISDVIKINTLANKMLNERAQLIALHKAVQRHSKEIDDNSDAEEEYLKNVAKRIEKLNGNLLGMFDKNATQPIVIAQQPPAPALSDLGILQRIAHELQDFLNSDPPIEYTSKNGNYLSAKIIEALQLIWCDK